MIYVYPIIHSLDVDTLEYAERVAIHVSDSGTITQVEYLDAGSEVEVGREGEEVVYANDDEFLVPGLVDTHAHAPQFTNIGYGFNLELLDWLNEVTFPTEASYRDAAIAEADFKRVVDATLSVGTTTCSYYSSLHLDATKILARVCHSRGQRALVGKVNMDSNSPDYYRDASAEESLQQTIEYVEYVRNTLQSTLVHPVITPRFAICCSSELLHKLGQYIQQQDVHVQTHLSENKGEIDFTMSLYPDDASYTHIYANRGILTSKSILAHCCHLSKQEVELVRQFNSGISHCPTSNFNLRSGITDVNELLSNGLHKIGLGSDCSGGYEVGILQSLRTASTASKALSIMHSTPSYLSLDRLFYLATLGGARVLSLDNTIGNFRVGKQFDALVINPYTAANKTLFQSVKPVNAQREHKTHKLQRDFERWLFAGTSANIQKVFVDGKQVV